MITMTDKDVEVAMTWNAVRTGRRSQDVMRWKRITTSGSVGTETETVRSPGVNRRPYKQQSRMERLELSSPNEKDQQGLFETTMRVDH